MFFIEPARNFYGRFERPISSLSLIAGFVFDALTLHRADTFFENAWILGHLVLIGVFIFLIHIQASESGDEANPSKKHFWYVNILQFIFGGTLSAYLVLYFRSADIFVAWPFIVILILAFIANESLKRYYVRLSFQISLFFLSIYAFTIFLLPIIFHKISMEIFLLSGIISLLFIILFIAVLFYFIKDKNILEKYASEKLTFVLIGVIFLIVNVLYFTNLIPPIPLSLKEAGVYHSIQRNSEGNYDISYEDYGWPGYFKLYPNYIQTPGKPVYVFSAIFSPKAFSFAIIHEWQHWNDQKGGWVTESVISLPVVGGRDGGFRTYSMRQNVKEGKWRVNIKTKEGLTMGHVRFNIINRNTEPVLTYLIK